MKVVCAQVAPILLDVESNRKMLRSTIREALAGGADLVVLPELATTGYMFTSAAEAREVAQPAFGGALDDWAHELQGTNAMVVGGFCELADGVLYNSAAAVTAQGVRTVYRKVHLWADEHLIFTPGTEAPPIVKTPHGLVGVAICYDLFFPELMRGLSLAGASVIALPTNSPAGRAPRTDHEPDLKGIGLAIARTVAYQNRVFVAVSDRCGDERGTSWTARSVIVHPEGHFLAGPVAYTASLVAAECDLSAADSKQWEGTTNDAHADRRPDVYGLPIQIVT
jgi:predicted amidohydrolase